MERAVAPSETPVNEAELDHLDYFRDLRDRHLTINGLRIAWRPKSPQTLDLSEKDFCQLYYFMALGRAFEERIGELFRQGLIPGTAFFGRGNEALSVGSSYALRPEDTLVPMHRNLPSHLVRGQALKPLMAQYLGREGGINRGREIHYADRSLNIFQLISHIGTMIPVATGAAFAAKYRGDGSAVLAMSGDGASSTGDFHEGFNFAAVQKLPLVLILENNFWAYKTPIRLQYACKNLALRAIGYGTPGYLIDGTDVLGVYEITREALSRARSGEGPILIESVNPRACGHSIYDAYQDYVPKEEISAWDALDPVRFFEAQLKEEGKITEEQISHLHARIDRELEEAVAFAKKSPLPQGPEILENVYAP